MHMSSLASLVLAQAFFAFALACALAGAVIGVGLIAARDTTLRFFSRVNAWVPMRARLKWTEVPHDIGRAVLARRGWFAAAFVAGGMFILLAAIRQIGVEPLPSRPSRLALDLALACLSWLMVAGSLLAIVIGVLLAISPATLAALEAISDRWVSTRQAGRSLGEGGDRMHTGLDRLVADHSRAAGGVLLFLSLACIVVVGLAFAAR